MARTVFGLPAYDGATHVAEALESLLGQEDGDLAVIVVDDASTDATAEIAERYAAIDPRVSLVRNPERVGMVENWRRCFALARARHPDLKYFAWASDHDTWHPRWLRALAGELERRPQAVLAYPLPTRVGADGAPLHPAVERYKGRLHAKTGWTFETRGRERAGRRFRTTVRSMSAGNMIYGLWRAEALERCGVFFPILAPDRLVVALASLEGEFVQSREFLWYRRFRVQTSNERQRRALFADDSDTWQRHWPWWASHARVIAGRRGPLRGLQYALLGLALVGKRKLIVMRRHGKLVPAPMATFAASVRRGH
jgi:glycosyltransferase involved in cell wall biosynthesis